MSALDIQYVEDARYVDGDVKKRKIAKTKRWVHYRAWPVQQLWSDQALDYLGWPRGLHLLRQSRDTRYDDVKTSSPATAAEVSMRRKSTLHGMQ